MTTTKPKPKPKQEKEPLTKVVFPNRYRDTVTIRRVQENTWLFDVDNELPWSFSASSIDPSGGPYIGVGTTLNEIHPDLPPLEITQISFGAYDVDASGYEYAGWLLHTK